MADECNRGRSKSLIDFFKPTSVLTAKCLCARANEAALAEADARLISWIDMKNHFTAR
jgi:hypothetical protein